MHLQLAPISLSFSECKQMRLLYGKGMAREGNKNIFKIKMIDKFFCTQIIIHHSAVIFRRAEAID